MDERATGLILRTRPLTETSLIVHWLTVEAGRLATVAKGARRAQSPFRGKLDAFYLADLSFARSRRSDLHVLREVGLRETWPVFRRDLARLRQAAYCAALIEQTTETETPMPELFELLLHTLAQVATHDADSKHVFAFELKLLAALGLAPDPAEVRLPPGTRQVLQRLSAAPWAELVPLRLSEAQVQELRHFLHGFCMFHLGRLPPGRRAALHG